jgi:spoIIIJ-associated protein
MKEVDESLVVAQAVCEKVLRLMGSEADVVARREKNHIQIEVQGNDIGVLIGKGGRTLEAIQLIVNLICAKRSSVRGRMIIDVGGYRKRQTDRLITLAERAADEAAATKEEVVIEPMPAFQRRIIHTFLQTDSRVTTMSQGEGEDRQVVVIPNE